MKVLIIAPCAAPSIDGPQHLPENTLQELETDVVHAIVHAGKGLYVDQKDDPSRAKVRTAGEGRIEAVRQAMKAASKAAKAADSQPA